MNYEDFGLEVVASLVENEYQSLTGLVAIVFRHASTDRLLWVIGEDPQFSIDPREPVLDMQSTEDLQELSPLTWKAFVAAVDAKFARNGVHTREGHTKVDFLRAALRLLPPPPTDRELRCVRTALATTLRNLRGH